ncbi:hypothetical protein like AT5G43650 [Hibiscus trionum]|uniref:BHLH domain-containing protein n=1 Tax=Hibiscus trionum TaxID=183268 RepID=A0A9W7LPF8_HIBTR|nr:hypothetical protein like AT5G43650 [Hibiscus trionum]
MDSELIKQLLQGEIFWYETATAPSAFVPYSAVDLGLETSVVSGCKDGGSCGNLNKRVIGLLKKSWAAAAVEAKDDERERSFRHMMNERMRREKQKSSYLALHSMLPHGTKNDKKSIVEMAAKRVQELEWVKKDLEENKIRVKIENPISGIDSMLEALKCLKALDSKPTMIRSIFSNQQFLALMEFQTQMGAAKVEKAVTRTLQETERKLQQRWTNQI